MATIYDPDIWERILEKHHLKNFAIELGVDKNPQKAKEMMETFNHGFGLGRLSKKQQQFCSKLVSVKFAEQDFLNILVSTGTQHYSVGANDYMMSSMELVLLDFESSFKEFIYECQKREKSIDNISFSEAYDIFLDVIKLKIKYQVPYTKLFVRKLIELSPECFKREDSLEIRQYFLEKNPKLLIEIQNELIL